MTAAPHDRRLWASGIVLLLVVGLGFLVFTHESPLGLTRTSHGTAPFAWGASYDVLSGLGLEPARTRVRLQDRDRDRTQWLIEPSWREEELEARLQEVESYAARGGTLVLIANDDRLWSHLGLTAKGPNRPNPDAAYSADPASESDHDAKRPPPLRVAKGPLVRGRRKLRVHDDKLFDAATVDPESVRAQVQGAPFMVELVRGEGRIVVVADSSWLHNDELGAGHHAHLLVDLVHAYGPPTLDEHCHGLVKSESPFAALGSSWSVLALFVTLLTVAVAVLGQRRWPLRKGMQEPPAPTLQGFTDSLAGLYERRGAADAGDVFEVYRTSFVRRMRRLAHGAADVSLSSVEKRLIQGASSGLAGRWMSGAQAPESRAELHTAVRALERYAFDQTRQHGSTAHVHEEES